MINNQFSSWPSYTEEEADAVHEVVLSNTKLNSNQIIDSVIAKIEKNYSKDFNIRVPKFVEKNIAKEIKVSYQFNHKPYNN